MLSAMAVLPSRLIDTMSSALASSSWAKTIFSIVDSTEAWGFGALTFGGAAILGLATTTGSGLATALVLATAFLTAGFTFFLGLSRLAGFNLLVGPSLRLALSLVLPCELLPAFSAKRTLAIMMVLSSAAVFGGFLDDEAFTDLVFLAGDFDFTAGLALPRTGAFLTGFFRGLVLYRFQLRCLGLRGRWFKLRIAVELSGRKGMGRNTQAGVLCLTSLAAWSVGMRAAA